MKYFLDTEFNEDGRVIDLISIGIVAEDGRFYYGVSLEADYTKLPKWHRQNILPLLPPKNDPAWRLRSEMRDEIAQFFSGDPDPELWAYYGSTDFVAYYQLYGRMMDLPDHMPHRINCLKQLAVSKGNPKLPKQTTTPHHALNDALHDQVIHTFLTTGAHADVSQDQVNTTIVNLVRMVDERNQEIERLKKKSQHRDKPKF